MGPVLVEFYSISQMVAAEVLEIQSRHALRNMLKVLSIPAPYQVCKKDACIAQVCCVKYIT